MRPIYDSDSNSVSENAPSSSNRPSAVIDNNRDASLTNSPQSGCFDRTVADANREIEELEKLLADKILSRQHLQQKETVQSQPKNKKIGSKRTLEYIGITGNEDNELLGPGSTEKRQRSQQTNTERSKRVPQNQPNYSQGVDNREDDEGQAQLQGEISTQSRSRRREQLEDTEAQRITQLRDRSVEDQIDHLQLCRQGGARRVLLVEHYNVWIDKAELMYFQRWVDNAPEMARRLLRLLVGNENLIHMCASGRSKNPQIRGIPPDILRSVEYYVNKKCSSRLQPSRYITIVNMMCQTLRHPKR